MTTAPELEPPPSSAPRVRGHTENLARVGRKRMTAAALATADVDTRDRPRTWGDCLGAELGTPEMPCPFVACKHHLAIDAHPRSGNVQLTHGALATPDEHGAWDLDLDAMPATCALRVADQGGATLEEVGAMINVTRERIRQVESRALAQLVKKPLARALHDDLERGITRNIQPDTGPLGATAIRAACLAHGSPADRAISAEMKARQARRTDRVVAPELALAAAPEPVPAPVSVPPPAPEEILMEKSPEIHSEPDAPSACAWEGCERAVASIRDGTDPALAPYCIRHRATVRDQRKREQPAKKPAPKPKASTAPASKPKPLAPKPTAPAPVSELARIGAVIESAGGLDQLEALVGWALSRP